jgi:hypothetical protein
MGAITTSKLKAIWKPSRVSGLTFFTYSRLTPARDAATDIGPQALPAKIRWRNTGRSTASHSTFRRPASGSLETLLIQVRRHLGKPLRMPKVGIQWRRGTLIPTGDMNGERYHCQRVGNYLPRIHQMEPLRTPFLIISATGDEGPAAEWAGSFDRDFAVLAAAGQLVRRQKNGTSCWA